MPKLDGFRATEKLKALMNDNIIQNIPIIGFSAYSEAYREPCLKSGMDDYSMNLLS
jgi:CheY-like chemotaxis protein